MRKLLFVAVLALVACQDQKKEGGAPGATGAAVAPQTDDQKTLYALGMTMGRNVEAFGLNEEELQYVLQGFRDQVSGKEPAVKLEEFGPKIGALYRKRNEERGKAQAEQGKQFLAKAAGESGAQRIESSAPPPMMMGQQADAGTAEKPYMVYIPTQEGTGASPSATDRVKVHYKGTLVDGKEFDSSYKRNEPATFPLNGVIRCWTEGLQKMKVGGKARLVCPPEMAYGPMGRPGIPPNATLNFEVELLEILPNTPPPGMPGMPGGMGGQPPKPAPQQPAQKK